MGRAQHRPPLHGRCGVRAARPPIQAPRDQNGFVEAFLVAHFFFNSASSQPDRALALAKIPTWFTCHGVGDFFCARSTFVGDLLSKRRDEAVRGVLEFVGLESITPMSAATWSCAAPGSDMVDFRSGRLFNLSDQDATELARPSHIVQGAASAVLPVIARPVPRLPVNPASAEDQAYLDGGIRLELPVLPLARRGAERVLVVSSAASILGETGRLKNALQIAARYIDVSTGGVTEGELQHAERHAESARFSEVLACEGVLGDAMAGAVSSPICATATRTTSASGRSSAKATTTPGCPSLKASQHGANDDAGRARNPRRGRRRDRRSLGSRSTAPPSVRIRQLWRMQGLFRDETSVYSTPGYAFDPLTSASFRARAEAARIRCFDIADILGAPDAGPERARAPRQARQLAQSRPCRRSSAASGRPRRPR